MNEDNEIYGSFAYVYDKFMDNVPYEKWSEYVQSLLKEYGIEEGLVLDLGCGTGSLTELLADAGYADGFDLEIIMIQHSSSFLLKKKGAPHFKGAPRIRFSAVRRLSRITR